MNDQNQLATVKLSSFDNQPIGKNNKFFIPEYAQNENPAMVAEVVNPEPKPLAERLKKNIQKVRREAVQELLALTKVRSNEFQPFQCLAPELLGGNDQIVMNNTLKIIVLYLNGGNTLKKDHKGLIKTLVDKCLCIQKDEIKSNSEQILYWLMDNKYEDLLLNELNEFLMNKNRKIVSTSLLCIAHLLNQYGIKRMKSLQLFYTSLQLLSSPAKPIAKNQTVVLMKEAYRWAGQACLTFYKVHMQIKEEIVKFGKDYQKVPMEIKRGVKKQLLKPGEIQKPVYHMQEEQVESHEPVDVLSGYTSQWVDHLFKIQKWKQKKEELDQFIKKTKIPHILPPRELSHFIFLIKKLLQENNINIFYCGLYIIQNLAKGLKKEFGHIAKNVLTELYNKLKDSKPMTVDLVHTTLLNLMHTLHLEDFIQCIKDGLNDKSPLMKEQTMKFLCHFIEKKDQKIVNLIRTLLDKLIQLTQDGSSKVRGQALQCLCALKIAHGMKFFGEKIKKLDPKKLQTIELTKPPQNAQGMQIEQPLPPPAAISIPIAQKQANTMKMKTSKSLQTQKSQVVSKNEIKNEQTSSVNSTGDPKVSRSLNLGYLQEISSSSQAVRANAYQNLAHKFLSKDIKQFIAQIRNNSIKQSSPNILKNILQIAKKYINNCVADVQITQFLIKHDWKKSKQLLTDFIQANRFTQQADQALRMTNLLLTTTNKIQTHQIIPTYTLKSFCIELQNSLITKMSSPIEEIKKQAAENMILMWESIPKIGSQSQLNASNGWNEEAISRFFNIVKCRLIENNVQIVTLYCRLLMQMMNKGVTAKYKHMKLVAQTLGNNLSKGCIQMKKLYREMVNNAPHLMFSMMQSDICNELNRDSIVEFLVENSQLFLKYADLKAFVNPFLHILCTTNIQLKIKQSLDSLFKQMIQIAGTAILQKEISRLKVSNIQAYNLYLANYNVCLNKNNYQQVNNSKNYHLRQDRLKYWEDQGWYGKVTSSHILKLANLMTNLGEPLSGLCTLLYLTEENINLLNSLQFGFLVQYSDVFFKFIYWRTIIDNKEAIQQILGFTSRLIGCVSYSITEIDLVLLLKSVINIVERFKQIFYNQTQSLFKKIFKINPQFQNNTFQFLINFLMENANPQSFVDQMLKLFMGCYQELLVQNLVQLARIPTVHRNQLFMRYIQTKCDSQHLIALGFKVAISSKKIINQGSNKLLSQQGGPQNTIPMPSNQIRTYIALFMLPSVVMTQRLNQLTENIDPCVKMQTYTKILYSVATPFLRSEIHSINVHHFLNKLTKVIGEPYYTKKTYLRELTRMLLYLLVDLDECPPEGINAKEYATIVNKCILTLIETSQVRHMLQILFLFEKRQIQLKQSSKITHLIIKCIGKTIKNNDFKLKMGQNTLYIIQQTNFIMKENDLPSDHSVVKSFKNILFFDLFRIYPASLTLLQDQITKGTDLHPYILQFFNDFVAFNQIPARNDQIEVPLKQHLKETHNMIRALGPVTINKVLSIKKAELGQSTQ